MIATLDTYQNGQLGIVKNVAGHPLAAKMTEMGIFAGQELKVLFRAPLGDPIAVDMDGYVLSLRLSEAKLIEMEGRFY
ncbi:MAG: ferrous iron transport protein A [Flavobacteriales bacterium]